MGTEQLRHLAEREDVRIVTLCNRDVQRGREVLDGLGLTETGVTSNFDDLIRYELGDYAVRGGTADTPFPHGHLLEIGGRVRDLFKRRDGSVFRPCVMTALYYKYLQMRGWQIVQTGYETVELRYVPGGRTPSHAELETLRADVSAQVGGLDVRIVPVDSIAAQPNGKRRETLCLV